MVIIVTLESAKSIPVVISKTLESDLNSEVWTTAISYEDTDIQVNQVAITFAAFASTTY